MRSILNILHELNVIRIANNTIEVVEQDLYLAKDSTYCTSWRLQIRSLTATRLQEVSDSETYSFSATFTASLQIKQEIQQKFLELLKSIKPAVSQAPSENVFQMNFDLFSWVK